MQNPRRSSCRSVPMLPRVPTHASMAPILPPASTKKRGGGVVDIATPLPVALGIWTFYVVADSTKILTSVTSVKGTTVNTQTITTLVSFMSLFIGIGISILAHGKEEAMRLCFMKRPIMSNLKVAAFFATSQAMNLMQYVFL